VSVALEMNLCYEWLIAGTDSDEMIMCAAPKISVGIGSIGNRANTLELIQARLLGDQAPAIAKVCSAV